MPWVRSGYCCRCGECCRGPIDGLPEQADGSCPYLGPAQDGSGRPCQIHGTIGTYWEQGCNVWPTDPASIKDCPSCTYRFAWAD